MTDKNKTALFIGNRDCYQVKEADIEQAIINEIENVIEIFLNGGQRYFDNTCAAIVRRLKKNYPYIKSILVLPFGISRNSMTAYLTRSSTRLRRIPFLITPIKAEVRNGTAGRQITQAPRSVMFTVPAALQKRSIMLKNKS